MAGLIAMTAVFAVVGIEMFFATRGAGHVHGADFQSLSLEEDGHRHGNGHAERPGRPKHSNNTRSSSYNRFRQRDGSLRPPEITLGQMSRSTENLVEGRSPSIAQPSPGLVIPTTKISDRDEDPASDSDLELDIDELDPNRDTITDNPHSGLLNGISKQRQSLDSQHPNDDDDPTSQSTPPNSRLTPDQHQKKLLLQCLLLEAGILFHSIFIGMALSVSIGSSFAVLLVAISFHQTFEGFALGSRIAALAFPARSPKPWLMALAYGTTTPLGQAIGLAVHSLYDPASEVGLLMVGVMNAVSSGLLLFAGMVELLAEDFLSDASYETLRGRQRLEACGAVVAGAALMALVGAWA
ncbi:hypothetical protein LTS18_011762 [Coniosporium uncinatum]|uniref:Uncharacterized protein n=1 Tax=Coniosporium uncinatum TaxID=93489 RepID=A0ACC3DJZ3_9PEZI|nr:hypothetical protein LTS18_011762 [Coniosporium uncinatum]